MNLARVRSMASSAIALDTETHALQPGLLAPPVVCGSIAWLDAGPLINGELLTKDGALDAFVQILEDDDIVLVGANCAYDIAVCVVELARLGIDVLPQVVALFEAGRVFDIQLGEALNAIANGHFRKDPRTKLDIFTVNPQTKKKKRGQYSLNVCVLHVLGRDDAKANDTWRFRYGELEHLPQSEWPQEARDYPVDDARNTLEVALAQVGVLPKLFPRHVMVDVELGDGTLAVQCMNCGSSVSTRDCVAVGMHANLVDHARQVESAFWLHLGAMWGFCVDQDAVDVVEKHALLDRERDIVPFRERGLIRADDTEDQSLLKRMVAIAYGCTESCGYCGGSGKVPSPKQKPLRCPDCKGRCRPWRAAGKIKEPTVLECATCRTNEYPQGSGLVPHPRPKMINCVMPDKGKTCDGTGFELVEDTPKTETGGVAKGRSILHESGDDFLMLYGDFKKNAKILTSYVPYLRGAVVDEEDEEGGEDEPEAESTEDAE